MPCQPHSHIRAKHAAVLRLINCLTMPCQPQSHIRVKHTAVFRQSTVYQWHVRSGDQGQFEGAGFYRGPRSDDENKLKLSPPTLCFWPLNWTHQNYWRQVWLGTWRWKWPCLFQTRCDVTTATSLATPANVAKLLQSVSGVEKINMKVSVWDTRCAPTAMVPMPHRLKIAQSGRGKGKFSTSALKNMSPFQKPDSWLKPRCWVWSLTASLTALLSPPRKKCFQSKNNWPVH